LPPISSGPDWISFLESPTIRLSFVCPSRDKGRTHKSCFPNAQASSSTNLVTNRHLRHMKHKEIQFHERRVIRPHLKIWSFAMLLFTTVRNWRGRESDEN
jgi:hypothetical protein